MKENRLNDTEIPIQVILEKMRKNTYYNFHNYSYSSLNKEYLNIRESLFNILQKITMKMGFKSQTYFLSIYYLDIIFMKKKKFNFNLYKISLGCLCISAKFCENDPNVPRLQDFIRVYNNTMNYKNIISMSDLMYAEVLICKLLNYKLNYYSIYDFNSFFFCHGILKFEQIKEIEKYFKKNFEEKNIESDSEIKNINTGFVKNILGKIYKKSRDYLDMIINMDKICLKYSPLYINVMIIKKSAEEILLSEFNENCPNSEEIREIFREKNYLYFKEIMSNFYKIDYESSEQYKQLITNEGILNIFKENNKINNNNTDNNGEKNKKFNNSMANGFYKGLKIKKINENTRFTYNYDTNKNKNNDNEKNSDDLDSNLNINELRKSQMIKNENYKISKTKKINENHIPRLNTYNTLDNNLKDKDKESNIKEQIKKKSESNSPLEKTKSIKYLNVKKINKNKKQKIKSLNEKVNNTFDSNQNNQIKLKNDINKKPYMRKLITLNSNKEIIDTIKASTSSNFYSSKIKPLQITNKQPVQFDLKAKNYLTHDNNCYSYIALYYNKKKAKSVNKNKKFINTSIGERYKKNINKNLNENESEINMKDKFNYCDKEKEKENIKCTTGNNFYPDKLKKIMVKINKESEIKNINISKEIKSKRLSLLLSQKNSENNKTLKEINKSFGKNIIEEYNKKGCITSRDNANEKKEIKLNLDNKKFDSTNMKYNKNKNISINVNKNNKIVKKAKNNTNNINMPNDKAIQQKLSFRYNKNNSINTTINDGSLTSRDDKIKINNNKTEDKFQSSIYQIIQKTKNLFNKKEKDDNPKKSNNNFYKTQQNFYKKNNSSINNIIDEKSKEKTYAENAKIKINNKKAVNQQINNKNLSIVIANNNLGNKKKIQIPQLNLSNAILNARNSYNLNGLSSKYNTQRNKNFGNKINVNDNPNTTRKTINKIFHKINFMKKVDNKEKK